LRILKIFVVAVLVPALTGCFGEPENKKERYSPVVFLVKEKSTLFSSGITLTIDSTDRTLQLSLNFVSPKNIPFPIDKNYKDTLSATAFKFEFYNNGKLVSLDRAVVCPSNGYLSEGRNYFGKEIFSQLEFASDTIDLKETTSLGMYVPFYAFQDLKLGKQDLELKIYQTVFCSPSQRAIKYYDPAFKDSSLVYKKYYAEKILLSATVRFSIVVPPIYKTTLYGGGLELRNDSTFSPVGMDNTIWNSSLPDIYWTVTYPKDQYYARTPTQKSTASYDGRDTFNIYHYSVNDSIVFTVYDYDDLSKDDWLGTWRGSLGGLSSGKRFGFGNVKWFDIKGKSSGIIN